jgi:ABC-type uncharacterized transport system substrate-binding protein
MLPYGSPATAALQAATSAVPIVFTTVIDPVGSGLVESLARPGGNTTGFTVFDYGMAAKWLELLKQIAPNLKRVAIFRDLSAASGSGQLGAIQSAAASVLDPEANRQAEE